MDEIRKIKTQCIDCERETNHSIINTKMYHFEENRYRYGKEYSVVQCLGCDHISFLQTFHDYEVSYPVEEIWTPDGGHDYRYDYDKGYTNFYPDAQEVFKKFEKILPQKLFEIYSETKKAYIQNLRIFTAIGIRSIIECICNDRKIKGGNLEIKISNLKNIGNISRFDIDMLHSLRFLGNEAVHDIKSTNKKELKIAFKIVDHLIQTIYIIPSELENTNFKKHIGDYEDFENYIKEITINNINSKIFTIKGMLGDKIKTSNELLLKFEKTLKENIKNKKIDWLEIVDSSNLPSESFENDTGVFYKRI